MLFVDWVMFWICIAFLVFMNIVFARPKGAWSAMFRRFWKWANTCKYCGGYARHERNCTSAVLDRI